MPVKSESQQALTALHRLRSTWLAARIARLNTVRGVLREFGIGIPAGARRVRPTVAALLADADTALPAALRPALHSAREEIGDLERRLREVERQIAALARVTPAVAALRTILGVGLLTSTALVAFVGEATRFPTARHFASYLGLTPRERSSGLRRPLGAISKRGAIPTSACCSSMALAPCSVTPRAQRGPRACNTGLSPLARTRGHNKAAVALANKLARIAWAVWTTGTPFKAKPPPASTLIVAPT